MQCTLLMFQDHVLLRRSLDVLELMVERMEKGGRIECADISAILGFLDRFGDEYHQTIEEKVLYPALMRGAADDASLSDVLSQHTIERQFISGIDEALKRRRGAEFARLSRQMSTILREHFDQEETIVASAAKSFLSEDDDRRIVAEMSAYPVPEIGVNFDQLERKYSRPVVQPDPPVLPVPVPQESTVGRFRSVGAGALSRVFGSRR